MNIMLPFFAVYTVPDASAADADPALEALFGDKIVICTPEGFKLVSLSELGGDGGDTSKSAQRYECALCYTAAHGINHIITEDGLVIVYDQLVQSVTYSDIVFLSGSEPACQPKKSRAPPFSA